MAETSDITLGGRTVLGLTTKVIKQCMNLIETGHDALQDIRHILIQISLLKAVLQSFEFLSKAEFSETAQSLADSNGIVEGCRSTVVELSEELDGLSLQWSLREGKVQNLLDETTQHKTALTLALLGDSTSNVKKIRSTAAAAVLAKLESGKTVSEADLKTKDDDGLTALHLAAKAGKANILRQVAELGMGMSPKDNEQCTPLHYGAKYDHEAVVKLLIDERAEIDATSKTGRTPLIFATERGNEKVVGLLLDQNASATIRTNYNRTVLHSAARYGYDTIVSLILERDTDLETCDNDMCTALHFAARYGHETVARLLLERNANSKAYNKDERTALHIAALYNHDKLAQLLLEKGADIESCDKNKYTALWLAAGKGNEDAARMLLEKDANIEACGKDNWTPLHAAVFNSHNDIVQLLIERKAEVSAQAVDACTPLMLAAEKGNEAAMKILLDNKASINDCDNDKWTALHWAAWHGHEAAVRLLLERNVNTAARTKDGKTSLLIAKERKHDKIAKALRDHSRGKGSHSSETDDEDSEDEDSELSDLGHFRPTKYTEVTLYNGACISTQLPKTRLFYPMRPNSANQSLIIAGTGGKTWDIDTETGLCRVCSSCQFGEMFSGGEIQHHLRVADLSAAGNSGCRLCSLIMPYSFHSGKKNAKVVCEVAWDENHMFWRSGILNPIVAMRFQDPKVQFAGFGGFSCTVGICTTEDDPLAQRVPYRLIESDSSSQRSFDAAARWLSKCLKTHGEFCCTYDSLLPTRVLYVSPESNRDDLRLVVTKGESGKWAALSHCWGSGPHFTTTTLNLEERQARIPFAELPATLRDAVTICRRLAIEYLWIDSLCILQDSDEDWRTESPKMRHIYINALLTIIAEASGGSHDGIFAAANAGRPPPPVRIPCLDSEGRSLGTVYPRSGAVGAHLPTQSGGDIHMFTPGPLSERAWTFQEDILSSRTLRFSADNLSWSCLTAFHGEANSIQSSPDDAVYSPKNFRRKDIIAGKGMVRRSTPQFWYTMVERYNQRKLTFEKDKLPAISAIAREIEAITKYTYKAGIWLEDAHTGLRWTPSGTGKRSVEYTAPSWSWASLSHTNGNFYNHFFSSSDEIAKILEMNVIPVGEDIYGQISSASLKISGPCHSVDAGFGQFLHIHNDTRKKNRELRHNDTYFEWDVEKGKPGCGIICMQIAKILPGDMKRTPAKIDALLLRPTDPNSLGDTYQRVGLLHIAHKDRKWAEGWDERTLIVV